MIKIIFNILIFVLCVAMLVVFNSTEKYGMVEIPLWRWVLLYLLTGIFGYITIKDIIDHIENND